ncbi:MAG: MmgE/PrpD family protein [Dehalococcoidia bacterium]
MSISPELQGLASLAIATKLESLPDQLVRELKYLVLDSIGCALAGIRTDPGRMFIDLGKTLGGTSESSLIGGGCKVSCVNAAMVNGQLINMIDYDALMPGHHTPPYIIAPSLAMAEREQASGADFLVSIAVGSEIAGRVGNAVSEGFSFQGADGTIFTWSERWGHAFCNFGVAAAVGKLLKLDTDKLVNAMGLSGHLCQVPTWRRFTFSEHRSMAKYGVPGWQNTGGVIAALLAQMGYMGDTTVFDDKEGFWKYAGYEAWNPENILKDIGSTWIMQRINYKPYPCCRMFQSELDCVLKIVEENKLNPEEIEAVNIYGHPALEAPLFTNREITNIVDIQFNASYIIAMAVNGVTKGVEWQDLETARSPLILAFAEKVSCQSYPEYGQKQMSIVEVVARNHVFREEKPFSELTKLTEKDVIEKYRHNASGILSHDKIEDSINTILELEKVNNIRNLVSQVTGQGK